MLPLLIAQANDVPDSWVIDRILNPEIMVFVVGIVAIVSWAAVSITSSVMRHRERIEKIRQGIDPDADSKSETP